MPPMTRGVQSETVLLRAISLSRARVCDLFRRV